ncbi:MAG: tetratricopeptide repeat protein, partial [Magnetococcales bacterium]|nr:tetratricopeptide repeat protein [Magnetococcales bacterium]
WERGGAEERLGAVLAAVAAVMSPLPLQVTIPASLVALTRDLAAFQPQVVLLDGEPLTSGGRGYLRLTDGAGGEEVVSGAELARAGLGTVGGPLVMVAARPRPGTASPTAAAAALARELVANGVDLALTLPGADDRLLRTLLERLAAGQGLDQSLAEARQASRVGETDLPTWLQPALWAADNRNHLFNVAQGAPTVWPQPHWPRVVPPPGASAGYADPCLGREAELAALQTALAADGAAVLVLTGPPGIGKTTLALALLQGVSHRSRPALVLEETPGHPVTGARLLQGFIPRLRQAGDKGLAVALKEDARPVARRLELLARHLRGSPWVLLLDGLTGEWERTLGDFLRDLLLEGAGASRILVTRRDPPPPLLRPRPAGLLEQIVGPPAAVALAGWLLAHPGLARRRPPGGEGWRWLERVARWVADRPVWLRPLVEPLLGDLGCDPAILRPEAVWEVWSSAAVLEALARLALLERAVPEEGLFQVAGMSLDTPRLAETGLLQGWQPQGCDSLWRVPAALGESLAGAVPLDEDVLQRTHRAAANYYLFLFDHNREHRLGLSWVDVLLEAVHHTRRAGDREAMVTLAGRVSEGLFIQGFHGDLIALNRRLLEEGSEPALMEWTARGWLGLGDLDHARLWYQQCLAATPGDHHGQRAAALHGLGGIDLACGRAAAARESFEQSLSLLRETGDPAGQASTWKQLAAVHLHQEAFDPAREALEQALLLHLASGDQPAEGRTLSRLGEVAARAGDVDGARRRYQAALSVQESLQDREGTATTLALWGTLELENGNAPLALTHLEGAIGLYRELDRPADLAAVLPVAGHLHAAVGRDETARDHFQAALPLLEALEQWPLLASVLHQLGVMDLESNATDSAWQRLLGAYRMRQVQGDRSGQGASLVQLGRLAGILGQTEAWRLVGIGWLLAAQADHPRAPAERRLLTAMTEARGLSWAQVRPILEADWERWLADGGMGLLREVFDRSDLVPAPG